MSEPLLIGAGFARYRANTMLKVDYIIDAVDPDTVRVVLLDEPDVNHGIWRYVDALHTDHEQLLLDGWAPASEPQQAHARITATRTAPPHVRFDSYDIGHEVVLLDPRDPNYLATGVVDRVHAPSGRSPEPQRTYSLRGSSVTGKQNRMAALAPGGDLARLEEVLPGEVLWPIGTRLRFPAHRVGREAIIVSWTMGSARVYYDAENTYALIDRDVVRAAVAGLTPAPAPRVWPRPPVRRR